MADHAHAAHGHGHAPDHVPHVTPLWIYLATWGTLVVLTAITVAVSYLNFGGWNLIIALLVATIKATVVAAMFMHLLHDHKFHTLILISGGLFLIIFVSFTMFDTEYRGRGDRVEGDRPADITRPFEMTEAQSKMKKIYEEKGPHLAALGSVSAHPNEGAPTPGMSAAPASASASGSAAPPARSDEPSNGAAPPASASASAATVSSAAASASIPPPPSASIAPAPGAPQKPAASAHN